MGPDVSVMDGFQFTVDHKEFKSMKKTYKVRTLMNTLIRYAQDAEEGSNEVAAEEKSEIDQLQGLIKKVAPLMQQIADLPTVMAKTEMEEESEEAPESDPLAQAAKDAEEEDKNKDDEEKEKEAKDCAAKDAEEKGTAKSPEVKKQDKEAGMDAKEIAAQVTKEVLAMLAGKSPVAAMDAKEIMVQVGQRDKLAKQLSNYVGTFDASEMTLEEVSLYGVKKLGLPIIAGQSQAVLAGYLKDRPLPKPLTGMDKKEGGSFIDRHLENKEK